MSSDRDMSTGKVVGYESLYNYRDQSRTYLKMSGSNPEHVKNGMVKVDKTAESLADGIPSEGE